MSNHPTDTTVSVENTAPAAHKRKPPPGIQGWGAAFRFSENDLRHWLMLLFPDRVNVVTPASAGKRVAAEADSQLEHRPARADRAPLMLAITSFRQGRSASRCCASGQPSWIGGSPCCTQYDRKPHQGDEGSHGARFCGHAAQSRDD